MKQLTKKQKEWLWFVGLWCAGFATISVVASLLRWLIK